MTFVDAGTARFFFQALAAAAFAVGSSVAIADDAPQSTPTGLVDALNALSGGPHAGYRANHAKGIVVTGSFAPAPTARALSKAPHFQRTVPAIVRFSNTTGVPNMPDASADASPHGMAIRFQLPANASTDIVGISTNSFPVATPGDFQALLEALAKSGPGVAKPTPIEQFLGSHPAALKFVTTPYPAPPSFATLAFYGVNAFQFTNAKGESHFIRYQVIPLAGVHALTDEEAKKVAPDYLMDELPVRIAQGPLKFRLMAQVAIEGDVVTDGTVTWPPERKLVELGTLTLTKMAPDQAETQRKLLFNPVSLPAGIAPSADPVLLARFPSYAVSFRQRAQ